MFSYKKRQKSKCVENVWKNNHEYFSLAIRMVMSVSLDDGDGPEVYTRAREMKR